MASSNESIKVAKLFFFTESRRPVEFLSLLTRIAILSCLVASITLVLYTAFSGSSTRFPRFVTPTRKPLPRSVDNSPTNISHILFGIGGSVHTWRERSLYSELWWDPKKTRGFVWLDEKPNGGFKTSSIQYRVSSSDWTRFRYSSSRSAVRIARIIMDSFKLHLPDVRWFLMGDDDTVFFSDNLVSMLSKYDHNQMWYIGGNSESVEQDVMHAYDMAYGGGGIAISYPLAARLVDILDGCLDGYYYFYGSDQRIWACIKEIGVPLTREPGFHQMDIRGSPYGLLAAHPVAPLVSLHHLDALSPLFPNQSRTDSVRSLRAAYEADPPRILQQSVCYDRKRRWSISVSWGYTVQIYPSLLPPASLQMPLHTFKTWRSWSDGPFTFNTRPPMKANPCDQPLLYFLDPDGVRRIGASGTLTNYSAYVEKRCGRPEYARAMAIRTITVSALKMSPDYWTNAPRRQCCEIMDGGKMKNGNLRIRIRKCRPYETVNA